MPRGGCKVRVYYKGLLERTASQLFEYPGAVEDARAGKPFFITRVERVGAPTFPADPEEFEPPAREEIEIVSKRIHLPAGSLNEIVRVYVPKEEDPLASASTLAETVYADIERGDTRGMYFFNPSDNHY